MAFVIRIAPEVLFPPGGGTGTRRPIDVRAPVELASGAIPGALHLPILDDEERHAVGVRYARDGQAAAVAEGERLVAPDLPRRIRSWRAACEERPSAFLCWRGGMRSERAQAFAGHAGTPRVEGGYKAVRAHLIGSLGPSLARRRPLVIAGLTGSGKTELLDDAARLPSLLALDLEAAAEHRGSAFGALGPQPPQQTFEHRLALPLLLGTEAALLLEDESRSIGRVHLPDPLYRTVRHAPVLMLEDDPDSRLARIHRDYALAPAVRSGPDAAYERLLAGILRLRRRLGTARTERIAAALREAHETGAWQEPEAFHPVFEPLLTEYYDPAYRRSLAKAGRPVVARGTREELLAWLRNEASLSPA